MTVRKWLWGLFAATVCAALAVVLVGSVLWRDLNAPLPIPDAGLMFEVDSGASLLRISQTLAARGILSRPRALAWYARLRGDATRIHAGEYRLQPGLSAIDLLAKLVAGEVYLHQFTIIEGWRVRDMLSALRKHPAIVPGTVSAPDIMAALGKPDLHPEGQFLPDTYTFPKGTPELMLLSWAHEALQTALAAAWAERSANIAIVDSYEALIMASIVEKETALAAERAMIAGVFHRRLALGMRLQTDPTVIYGLGDRYDGNLRRRDLDGDTPYNTYTRRGLPPTPIALAGNAALMAAVMPDDGSALYFVATGEPDGSHRFSETLEAHNRAVRDYVQRQRRSNQ